MKNCDENAFETSLRRTLDPLIEGLFQTADYANSSERAIRQDLYRFARWFCAANNEPFVPARITTRDVADFRDAMRRQRNQAVSTVNRSLVAIRRLFGWLQKTGQIPSLPCEGVKELRRQELAPKTLERSQVRKLLRECEARGDVRAAAIFSFMLFTGCRVSELVGLDLADLNFSERSGWATFRFAKGGKQRTVPVPLSARKNLEAYLPVRLQTSSAKVFLGERGPLTDAGVRALCRRYSAIVGVHIHPHLLRHVFGHEYLAANQNDLVGLASLMGHESLNTTRRYTARTSEQLQAAAENLSF